MICFYCKHEIDTDEPGWGENSDSPKAYHLECLNIYEDVQLA